MGPFALSDDDEDFHIKGPFTLDVDDKLMMSSFK